MKLILNSLFIFLFLTKANFALSNSSVDAPSLNQIYHYLKFYLKSDLQFVARFDGGLMANINPVHYVIGDCGGQIAKAVNENEIASDICVNASLIYQNRLNPNEVMQKVLSIHIERSVEEYDAIFEREFYPEI